MSPFVGRREELEAIDRVARRTGAGVPTLALVVGDPGIGKSRLVTEAARAASFARRFELIGYEPETLVPFSAASQLVRPLAAMSAAGRRLEQLLYETPTERSALERVRIFEATHRALRTAGPALVVVDDLQWVDDLSLALVHFLLRAAATDGQSLAVIAASRPSPKEATFSTSVENVLQPDHVLRFELEPLSAAEGVELIKALAPALGDDEARAIAKKAAGSPFWLEAVTQTQGSEATATRLVTARLRGCDADAGELVALLAVAARPLALGDVARLSQWEQGRAERSARDLVRRGIAVESGGVVRLAHDLIRAAAARDVPDEQWRDVQRRVGEWLAEVAGDDVRTLAEALRHTHAVGSLRLDLALGLARSPQRTLIGEEGLALLVAVADAADPFDDEALELNEDIASLASALARHDVALDRRLLLVDRRRDPLTRARALIEASRSAHALDDGDAAHAYLERARATGAVEGRLELELEVQEATLDLWRNPKGGRARARAHEAAARARDLLGEDEEVRVVYLEALRVEHEASLQEDDPEAMLRIGEERAAAARGFDEDAYFTAVLGNARALRGSGRLEEALADARRVRDEAKRRVLPRLELDGGYWVGMFLLRSGRIYDAEDVAAETVELASRVGDEARARHAVERLACEVDFHARDWRDGVQRLLAYAGGAGEHRRIELHQLAALWLALAGGEEVAAEVLAQIEAARRCEETVQCPRCAAELALAAADALARVGRPVEGAQWLAVWKGIRPPPQPPDEYVQRRVEALLHEQPSAEQLEAAARDAETLGFGLDALITKLELGAALTSTDRARAKEILIEVADTAALRGGSTILELAEKRLRGLGVRTWRRGAVSAGLTDREREIVHLIGAGASNPEIAQRLFLSRKTVERHVSNALRKVGARNRAELATKVADHEVEGAPR